MSPALFASSLRPRTLVATLVAAGAIAIGAMTSSAAADTPHSRPSGSAASAARVAQAADEELSFDSMVFSDGEAGVALIGPTLVAKGIDQQVLIADVTNHSTVEGAYEIQLEASGISGSATFSVPAEKTGRIEVPITVTEASDTSTPVTATLLYRGAPMSTSTIDVTAVDLSEPEVETQVAATLEEVAADPPAGLDQDVIDALDATVADEVGVDLSRTEAAEGQEATTDDTPVAVSADEDSTSLPLPLWALGLIAVGVGVGIGIGIGGIARRRS